MTTFFRRTVSILLLLALFCQPFLALAEEGESVIQDDAAQLAEVEDDPDALAAEVDEAAPPEVEKYVATAMKALRVRRGPGTEHGTSDSIPKGSTVYIVELGTEWSKVRTVKAVGYVQTALLADIRDYNASRGIVGAEAEMPDSPVIQSVVSSGSFKAGYKAYAVKNALVYQEPDQRTRILTKVPTYEEVLVSHVQGEWSYILYNKYKGYVLNTTLFKWDRIDPYAGPIPGNIVYPTIAFMKHTTDILAYNHKGKKPKVLKTINPGAAICVELPDEQGRYKTPYWRTTGYVTDDDIAYKMSVVPYDQAQPGDLVSVMTTYYAVGVHTLQYQGRNWNIYLATTMITDTIVQPGAQVNVNKVIGPYRRSTGYKPAPIASPTALWGYGGGTCQVNTTLYNTIIQVPILVNHRKVHANIGAKYFLKGFDAAVGGNDINMIFTNTLPYPIRFTFMISDGALTCCIFRAG